MVNAISAMSVKTALIPVHHESMPKHRYSEADAIKCWQLRNASKWILTDIAKYMGIPLTSVVRLIETADALFRKRSEPAAKTWQQLTLPGMERYA